MLEHMKLSTWYNSSTKSLDIFVDVAIRIAEMVDRIHKQNDIIGILHLEHLLFAQDNKKVIFAPSSNTIQSYKVPEIYDMIPHQQDPRSDFYALGVLLLHLLKGEDLPLSHKTDNPHDISLYLMSSLNLENKRSIDIVPFVEQIIYKLLEDNSEHRYQTTIGILYDFRQCQHMIQMNDAQLQLPIGEMDRRAHFNVEAPLFGREEQIQLLEGYYVAVKSGESHFIHFYGERGIGLNSIIIQFLDSVRRDSTIIAQVNCGISQEQPYAPIIELVNQAFEDLWSEPFNYITTVRDRIEAELGKDISGIWSLFPRIAELLRLFPARQADVSINDVLLRGLVQVMLKHLLRKEKCLIVYLNRIEEADSLTKSFIADTLNSHELKNVLVLARSTAPYSMTLSEKENAIIELELKPLTYEDTRKWLSFVFGEETAQLRVFTRMVYDRTAGIPKLIQELLCKWHSQKQLYFDDLQLRWRWDDVIEELTLYRQASVELNEEGAFNQLSEDAQHILSYAAVLGMQFNSNLLASVMRVPLSSIQALLGEAELHGIICREQYDVNKDSARYMFMSEYLYAYARQLSNEEAANLHYRIGQSILEQVTDEDNESLLLTVQHLSEASTIMSIMEVKSFIPLTVRATKYMNQLGKYKEVSILLHKLLALLDMAECSMQVRCSYYIELAYSEYMMGNMEQAKAYFQYLIENVEQLDREDRITVSRYLIEMYSLVDNAEAIKAGGIALKQYDVQLPDNFSNMKLIIEIIKTQRELRKLTKQQMIPSNKSVKHDENLSRIINTLMLALIQSNPNQMMILIAQHIRRGIHSKFDEFFIIIIGLYEIIIQRAVPALYNQYPSNALTYIYDASIEEAFYSYRLPMLIGFIKQLDEPEKVTSRFMQSLIRSIKHNDHTVANIAIICLMVMRSSNLNELKSLFIYFDEEIRGYIDEKTFITVNVTRKYVEALQSSKLLEQYVAESSANSVNNLDSHLSICKMEAAYYAGKYREALDWASAGISLLVSLDSYNKYKIIVFETLSLTALYPAMLEKQKKESLKKIKRCIRLMRGWQGAWNKSSAFYALIMAEYLRVTEQLNQAKVHYYEAIRRAKAEDNRLVEGIASQRLYDFYEFVLHEPHHTVLLVDACDAFATWGMLAMVDMIKAQYPHIHWYNVNGLINSDTEDVSENQELVVAAVLDEDELRVDGFTRNGSRDAADVLADIVHLSSFDGVENPLESFLELAVSQVGATRGLLVSVTKDEATLEMMTGAPWQKQNVPPVPEYICRYVLTTGEPLQLDYAISSAFMKDPYVQVHEPKSIICVQIGKPLNNKVMMLYLEHSSISHLFNKHALHLLEILITRLTYKYWMETDMSSLMNSQATSIESEEHSQQSSLGLLVEPLTQRELEVLEALVVGDSNKEIAAKLSISEATVKTHLSNLYGKLGVKRRGQAIARSKELNLIK